MQYNKPNILEAVRYCCRFGFFRFFIKNKNKKCSGNPLKKTTFIHFLQILNGKVETTFCGFRFFVLKNHSSKSGSYCITLQIHGKQWTTFQSWELRSTVSPESMVGHLHHRKSTISGILLFLYPKKFHTNIEDAKV